MRAFVFATISVVVTVVFTYVLMYCGLALRDALQLIQTTALVVLVVMVWKGWPEIKQSLAKAKEEQRK